MSEPNEEYRYISKINTKKVKMQRKMRQSKSRSSAHSERVAQIWFKHFKSGNFDIKDARRSASLVTDKMDAIFENMEQDRHISSYEEPGIDHKTVLTRLKRAGLRLSYNDLGPESALALCAAIEGNNQFTHLDLSWNKLFPAKGIGDLLRMLGENTVLVELNLSWNGLTVAQPLRKVMTIPTLKVLDLSNNRLTPASVRVICASLRLAKKLVTLDLSNNPLTTNDAVLLLEVMKETTVKLKNLFMDNVTVNKEFAMMLPEVLSMEHRKKTTITYGKVIHNYTLSVPDLREIVMKRLFYITDSAKKCTMDMPVYFLKMVKIREVLQPREFMRDLKISGAALDEGLVDELANCFPGPKTDKGGKTISLAKVVEFVHRLWPDAKAPVTPPPEPEKPKKKKKGKKK
ncbi:unnamed protein product [Diatraea saccharalis]|uniref:Uncharacterized protein n=1 Tax=Diatraea saccharalis TaxID=40085 RepID=A0A9N9W7V6_9NEOP|nr:unnamed protein product [Diatraea saccharalis]